ncbi:S-formylglutathione hydrolase [Listeria fleischmannii]|uniref:S-formylglutathione hydrolase n=1 Tax=Listeria fleischmannii FSL S10-1203 TaxID=1265822 RepID=W7DST2_9LIST|nr:S-formylglutathione hydrolase [Listeria fleischmannii]EUJ48850.1 S-formylglutathione hydrolase YeiG [Listeria fleischmannii FSL S10-1203]
MHFKMISSHRIFNGRQIKYRHHSSVLNCDMTFSLYLPESSSNHSKTALIWWLSGLTCTDDNFSQKGAFQKYASEKNLAFVIPDTSPRGDTADSEDWDLGQGASFYLNATQDPWKENFQMYDYLTKELPELVYPLIPNFSGKESIMGHSMGGHGSLIVGLKNPERFSAISAFAPILNPAQVPWGKKAFTAYLGQDPSKWNEWDATNLIQIPSAYRPPIMITQGTADEFYETQLKENTFLAAAQKTNAEVIYQKEEDYDHSYFTIATFIEKHILFHYQQLNQ